VNGVWRIRNFRTPDNPQSDLVAELSSTRPDTSRNP
jgi:hypothetical protein